jgi:hypothetical protein
MEFELLSVSSPHRESLVVELWWRHELAVEVWDEQGEMRCALFQRRNGKPHEFPLGKLLEALNRAWSLLRPPE